MRARRRGALVGLACVGFARLPLTPSTRTHTAIEKTTARRWRLKDPNVSTPRRALGAPQPKLRREVAERALQRPRARRALPASASAGDSRRTKPQPLASASVRGTRTPASTARARRRVGLVARVRRLAPHLSRGERDDLLFGAAPDARPGVLERRARAGGVEAPPGRAVEDDLLAAQRVLDRAAQRLVGVVSAVYGD